MFAATHHTSFTISSQAVGILYIFANLLSINCYLSTILIYFSITIRTIKDLAVKSQNLRRPHL